MMALAAAAAAALRCACSMQHAAHMHMRMPCCAALRNIAHLYRSSRQAVYSCLGVSTTLEEALWPVALSIASGSSYVPLDPMSETITESPQESVHGPRGQQ
jgi:hypothetical protein